MKFSDYLLTFFILLIFAILYLVGVVLSRIKEIQNNWPKYRCDPGIMIFADFFGYDSMENFGYCIAQTQKEMMGEFLKPIYHTMNLAGNLGGNLIGQLDSMRDLLSISTLDMGSFTSSMTGGIKGVMDGVTDRFDSMKSIFKQGDAAGKAIKTVGEQIPGMINTVIKKADNAI